jgi:hypothetical protein
VPINDSTYYKQLTKDFENVAFENLAHGGSHVPESQSHDKKRHENWRRIKTVGSIGTQDHRYGPTIPMREYFETLDIKSPEHGGIYPPKSQSPDMRSREKSERVWTVEYTGTWHRR